MTGRRRQCDYLLPPTGTPDRGTPLPRALAAAYGRGDMARCARRAAWFDNDRDFALCREHMRELASGRRLGNLGFNPIRQRTSGLAGDFEPTNDVPPA